MSSETDFLAALRGLPSHPAARGFADDAAVLAFGGATLVLTHDMLAEGIHFLPSDPPDEVAWKLLAVNLSDLAAKGARPLGVLLGYSLGNAQWDQAFVAGLGSALTSFGVPLLGGDTVSTSEGASRVLGLTAIGEAIGPVPSRSGAAAGDRLWVSGTIGDAGAGLRTLLGELNGSQALVQAYRCPQPRLQLGSALAPLVNAMMDVSDGLLIDTARLADASGLACRLELRDVPLSDGFVALCGADRQSRIDAATAGDDYELLFAAAAEESAAIGALSASLSLPLTCIGSFEAGAGLAIADGGEIVPLPPSLGYEHGGSTG